MKTAAIVTLLYGLLIFIGGLMGHAKAASTASLVMGIVFGLLLLIAAYGLFKKRVWGAYSALALLVVLDAFFTYRFLKTMKFFPSGFFSLLSLSLLFLLIYLFRKKASAKA